MYENSQADENNRLRFELQKKLKEIEKSVRQLKQLLCFPSIVQKFFCVTKFFAIAISQKVDDRRPVVENQGFPNTSDDTPSMFLQSKYNTDNTVLRALAGTAASNATLNSLHTNQQPSDNASRSPLFSPSTTSLSPPRLILDFNNDKHLKTSIISNEVWYVL